jgi:hypothetical protein
MTLEAVAMPHPAEADRGELAKFAYGLPTATAVRDGPCASLASIVRDNHLVHASQTLVSVGRTL